MHLIGQWQLSVTLNFLCRINYPRETWAALNERVFTDSASQGPAPRHRSLGLWCWIKGYSNFLFTALIFFIDLGSQVLCMNNFFLLQVCTYWFLFLVKYLEYLFWNINIAYPHFLDFCKWSEMISDAAINFISHFHLFLFIDLWSQDSHNPHHQNEFDRRKEKMKKKNIINGLQKINK